MSKRAGPPATPPFRSKDSCADLLAWAVAACPEVFRGRSGEGSARRWVDVTAAAQAFVAASWLQSSGPVAARTWVVVPDLRTQENAFNDLATW
ncbi:MAG: hypothetical protein ACKV19_16555, partial [Verrucomicrobiales bacterium]